MPLASDRQVNEKPFEIGMNSQKSAGFDPLSWEKTVKKGEVRARALRSWEDRGTSGRWHIHCAIELPSHFDGITLENLIHDCWAKVEWGYDRILVRDGANAGWINYMLKDRQKSEFDGFIDCIIIESLHNPIADA